MATRISKKQTQLLGKLANGHEYIRAGEARTAKALERLGLVKVVPQWRVNSIVIGVCASLTEAGRSELKTSK